MTEKGLTALVRIGILGLALQGGCQDSRARANQRVRTVRLEFIEKYSSDRYELNDDYIHYSFTSPICPGRWEGSTFSRNDSLYFDFPSECDGIIPLVGYAVPHQEGCRQTYYNMASDVSGGVETNRQAELVINTIPEPKSGSPRAYIPVSCTRKE